ncbi:hypothetical protein M8494_16775 [Serratia ureilytica]
MEPPSFGGSIRLLPHPFSAKFDTEFSIKDNIMTVQPILADSAVSISDFKKSPNAALKEAQGQPVAVLTNGKISILRLTGNLEAIAEYRKISNSLKSFVHG